LKPCLLGHICLVVSLLQGSYTTDVTAIIETAIETHLSCFFSKGSNGISVISLNANFIKMTTMKNTIKVAGGKPITVRSQFVLSVRASSPLVAFYGIYGRKREVLLFLSRVTQDKSKRHRYQMKTNSECATLSS
jgi:hypothetical protein